MSVSADNVIAGSADKVFDDIILSYFICPPIRGSKNVFAGAILITDAFTKPLYFAYVEPVRPTSLQRLLYGDILNDHIETKVIPTKLFNNDCNFKPDIVLVNSLTLLAARDVIGIPMAHVSRNDNIDRSDANHSPYVFNTGGYEDDIKYFSFSSSSIHNVDLLEPFRRMLDALAEVLKSEQA
jgi:hypothetical protein